MIRHHAAITPSRIRSLGPLWLGIVLLLAVGCGGDSVAPDGETPPAAVVAGPEGEATSPEPVYEPAPEVITQTTADDLDRDVDPAQVEAEAIGDDPSVQPVEPQPAKSPEPDVG